MKKLIIKQEKYYDYFKHNKRKCIVKGIKNFFAVVGAVSALCGLLDIYFDTDKALQMHRDAVEHYADEEYEEVIDLESKAYKINRQLDDVIYYYAMALINTEEDSNIKKAKQILKVNKKFLSDNERVLYGFLEWHEENYQKCLEILEEVDKPIQLDAATFNKYIIVLADASFQIDYQYGLDMFNKCSKLITLKKNTLGVFLEGDNIFQIPGKMVIDEQDFLTDDLYTVQATNVELANIFMHNTNGKNDSEMKVGVLENSSQDITGFTEIEHETFQNFYHYFNEFLRVMSGYENIDSDMLLKIFDNLIIEGRSEAEEVVKVKLLKNIVSDTYGFGWEKEDVNLPYTFNALGIIDVGTENNIDKVMFNSDSIFFEKRLLEKFELELHQEFLIPFYAGEYNAEKSYKITPIIILDNGDEYIYRLIPCFFD